MPGADRPTALPTVVSGRNEWLRDSAGREYIDLNAGYGTVWLGHNHPAVTRAVGVQLERYAAPGYLPTGTLEAAEAALRPFLPSTHFLGGIYSTGMEAMETALRAASIHTGNRNIAGFRGSTHGRSFLTAALGGENAGGGPGFVHSLPSFADPPHQAATELQQLLRGAGLGAIVVEPIQMTGGGHAIARELCDAMFDAARERGIPLLFDETLTGLYRCGERFYFDTVGQVPDLLVIGKGMANGFPAAAVVLRNGFTWDRARVRPGSTFWNHPLACAATTATLTEIARLDAPAKVGQIAGAIQRALGHLELRGRGAMWCLGCPRPDAATRFAGQLLESGVVVSYYDRYIRLLPPLTIGLDTLASACEAIRKVHADTLG